MRWKSRQGALKFQHNPKELTKLAEEREKIIKEFEELLKI